MLLKVTTRPNKLQVSNTVTRIRVTSSRGPQGEQGPQGPEGPQGDPATNLVQSVNGKQGVVVLNSSDIGADPAGSATQAELNAKQYTDTVVAQAIAEVLSRTIELE